MTTAPHLPNEILLEILDYIRAWDPLTRQSAVASFCLMNRHWYNVAIAFLYEAPYLSGRAYELFVKTVCPSVNPHIKHTSLALLIKSLDLSHIIHQSSKSTTARLLARTKHSLRHFTAPQASFAINSWASLSKCTSLRTLDLSLVSEAISAAILAKTLRQLPQLVDLRLPRCSASYADASTTKTSATGQGMEMEHVWPQALQHLSLSGSLADGIVRDFIFAAAAGDTSRSGYFPPSLTSVSMLHSPRLEGLNVKTLLCGLGDRLTQLELRDLPLVKYGRFNRVLEWAPRVLSLTISLDFLTSSFALPPHSSLSPSPGTLALAPPKPLQHLHLLSSASLVPPNRRFTPLDLFTLLDERILPHLVEVWVARSTGWEKEAMEELGGVAEVLDEVEGECWIGGWGVYAGLAGGKRKRRRGRGLRIIEG